MPSGDRAEIERLQRQRDGQADLAEHALVTFASALNFNSLQLPTTVDPEAFRFVDELASMVASFRDAYLSETRESARLRGALRYYEDAHRAVTDAVQHERTGGHAPTGLAAFMRDAIEDAHRDARAALAGPAGEAKCAGPFVDAFECPVHNPIKAPQPAPAERFPDADPEWPESGSLDPENNYEAPTVPAPAERCDGSGEVSVCEQDHDCNEKRLPCPGCPACARGGQR